MQAWLLGAGMSRAGFPLRQHRAGLQDLVGHPTCFPRADDGRAYGLARLGVSESSAAHSAGGRGVPLSQFPGPFPLLPFSQSAGQGALASPAAASGC